MDTKGMLVVIGERIRNARRRAKLTQTELGKRAGYSLNGIAKIERGQSDPKITGLAAIANALGMPLSALVMPAGAFLEELLIDRLIEFATSGEGTFSVKRHTTPSGGITFGVSSSGHSIDDLQSFLVRMKADGSYNVRSAVGYDELNDDNEDAEEDEGKEE